MDGIIFDMDGVLFDSERLYRDAWYQAGRRMKLPDVENCVKACVGLNWRDTVRILTEKYGHDFPAERFRGDIKARFNDMVAAGGLPVKPGAREILRWLSDAGLTEYFNTVVTGDMVTCGKPDPEIYRTACERLGINPSESIAVEDSPNGIRSAYGAGLRVIMVPDLIAPTAEINKLLFKTFVSLLDVKAYIMNIKNEAALPVINATEIL